MEISKICVAGLGTVGLPTAVYMAKKGISVRGYDISEPAVERAKNKGIHSSTTLDGLDVDAFIVCVSTEADGKRPAIAPVVDVVRKIARMSPRPPLVSIESTMPPGSCRGLYAEYLGSTTALVHVPHRYWGGDPVNHGVRQVRVIGAIDERSLKAGVKLYKGRLDIPLHKVGSLEIAEASKVLENAFRYIQIAFAEEAKTVLNQAGINFEETRESSNTKWNIEIPEAREGIGGHCLPKDILYMSALARIHPLIDGAIEADKQYVRALTAVQKIRRGRRNPKGST